MPCVGAKQLKPADKGFASKNPEVAIQEKASTKDMKREIAASPALFDLGHRLRPCRQAAQWLLDGGYLNENVIICRAVDESVYRG